MSSTDTFAQLRVLLVDDEPFVRRVAAKILENLGIAEVYEAENGLEAIQSLDSHEVDLLLTDIQMPEMNGIELIKQIRMGKTAADRELRAIVITSFSYTEVLSSCLLLDINGFLVKPITVASAGEKIQFALREKVHIHAADTYRPIKTDLAVIEADGKKEQEQRPNAAIVIDTPLPAGSQSVSIGNLKPGMELLEDLFAGNGIKLLPKGCVLTEIMINRIHDLHSVIAQREIRIKSN